MCCFSKFGRKISEINFPIYFRSFVLYNMNFYTLRTQLDQEILNICNGISSEDSLKNPEKVEKIPMRTFTKSTISITRDSHSAS